jgi:hypothetical protein
MRRIAPVLIGLLMLGAAVPAQAAKEHLGSFTYIKYGPNFRHRVFLRVESSNHGDKTCTITLNGRVGNADLGTDGESETFNMFYLFVHGAEKAYEQAKAAPSPTKRIRCSH